MARKRKQGAQHVMKCGGSFAAIPHDVIDSPAYADLTSAARDLLMMLVRRFNGHNNGAIGLDQRTARESLKASPRKVKAAFDDLLTHGFIELAEDAVWTERRAREYRLTWATSGKAPPYRAASLAYREWSPAAPVLRIDRNARLRLANKSGVTDAVAAQGNLATDAVADHPYPVTAEVTGEVEDAQNSGLSDQAVCYPCGSPYSNTMGGRRKLTRKPPKQPAKSDAGPASAKMSQTEALDRAERARALGQMDECRAWQAHAARLVALPTDEPPQSAIRRRAYARQAA